jgi:hypothetical protein
MAGSEAVFKILYFLRNLLMGTKSWGVTIHSCWKDMPGVKGRSLIGLL